MIEYDRLTGAEIDRLTKLYDDIMDEVEGLWNPNAGRWDKIPLRLDEQNYEGRASGIAGQPPLSKTEIGADLRRVQRQEAVFAKKKAHLGDRERNNDNINKMLSDAFEYTVASELELSHWMAEDLDDNGQEISADQSEQEAVPPRVRMASKYDDFFNHVDCVFRPGGHSQAEDVTAFSFDATFTPDCRVLQHKLHWDLDKIMNEQALLPVKYCSIEDFDDDSDPAGHQSPVGIENVPRFILGASKRRSFEFIDSLDEQKSREIGRMLTLQMYAESLVMSKIAQKAWTDYGKLETSPLVSVIHKEQTAHDYFAKVIQKKSLNHEFPDRSSDPEQRWRDYILTTPRDTQSVTVVAFYLSRLHQLLCGDDLRIPPEQRSLKTYEQKVNEFLQKAHDPEIALLVEYADYEHFLEAEQGFLLQDETYRNYQTSVQSRRLVNNDALKDRRKQAEQEARQQKKEQEIQLIKTGSVKIGDMSPSLLKRQSKMCDKASEDRQYEILEQTMDAIEQCKNDYLKLHPDADEQTLEYDALKHAGKLMLAEIYEKLKHLL